MVLIKRLTGADAMGFSGSLVVENLPASAGVVGSVPGSGRSPGEGRQPTPVLLPGKSHVEKSLVGYSPWRSQKGRT